MTLRERYDEKELKNALIDKVNNFLMELGTGFAYMGKEVRIEVGDTEKFIDMLFYNTQRHCYVVVEIKTGNLILLMQVNWELMLWLLIIR